MDMNDNFLEFNTYEDVESYVNSLPPDPKLIIDMFETLDGKYLVRCQEQKYYVAQDGKTYPDEVWFTREGKSIQVQDIEIEHIRNILRMILRKDRLYLAQKQKEILAEANLDEDGFPKNPDKPEGKIVYH